MNGKLYAVAPPGQGRDASVRWTFDFGEHPGTVSLVVAPVPPFGADGVGSGASPTVASDGTIYIGANNSNFYAVSPDGHLQWLFEAEREVAGIWSTAALSADEQTLYFGANKGGIYAINRENGALRWQFGIFASVYNSPTIDRDGILYTGSTVGHVYGVNSANGQRVFDFNAERPVWTTPAIRPDGSLVVADREGRVMLLGAV
jgi:outer membrane protein assembly factor BamB